MDYQTISFKDQVVAIVCKEKVRVRETKYISQTDFPFQVCLMALPAGKVIRNHRHHLSANLKISSIQEFLFVQSGKMRVSLYNDDWELIKKVTVKTGDFIFLVSGGHGFEMLEKTHLIEVKQGPYDKKKISKLYPDDSR